MAAAEGFSGCVSEEGLRPLKAFTWKNHMAKIKGWGFGLNPLCVPERTDSDQDLRTGAEYSKREKPTGGPTLNFRGVCARQRGGELAGPGSFDCPRMHRGCAGYQD